MQIKNSSKMYRSMFDCAKYVYRTEGLAAFYVSYPTTLSMTVPFTALQFLAYESISTTMNPTKAYDPMTHCLAGAVAGGFAAALTTPMDVIKTMLQTRGTASDAELRTVNGFMAGCRLLFRREGFRGFFKGVRPRVVTTMPSTAICWSAYEASKYVKSHWFLIRSRATNLDANILTLQGLLHSPECQLLKGETNYSNVHLEVRSYILLPFTGRMLRNSSSFHLRLVGSMIMNVQYTDDCVQKCSRVLDKAYQLADNPLSSSCLRIPS